MFVSHRDAFKVTVQADIASITVWNTVPPRIMVSGNWGKHEEIKLGLVQGLCSRSRSHPLKKARTVHARWKTFRWMRCNAIFSDLQLSFKVTFENLSLVSYSKCYSIHHTSLVTVHTTVIVFIVIIIIKNI